VDWLAFGFFEEFSLKAAAYLIDEDRANSTVFNYVLFFHPLKLIKCLN